MMPCFLFQKMQKQIMKLSDLLTSTSSAVNLPEIDMMNNGKVQLDDTSKRYLRPDFPVSNEGEFYGFFDPYKNTVTGESRNIIVLDTKNIINDGYGRLIETLAHEGWHAVQYEYGQIITNSKNTLDYIFPYDDLENAASYVGQRMYNKYINQNRL